MTTPSFNSPRSFPLRSFRLPYPNPPRAILALGLVAAAALAQPAVTVDLANVTAESGLLTRVHGSTGLGILGVPVAAGRDCDGDGFADYAVAYITADAFGRGLAGEIDLVFGDGRIGSVLDTAASEPRILRITGAGESEAAGNEIWIDDVTGDGLGDLLIGRQNFTTADGRVGAGALTVLVGSAALRELAGSLDVLDLARPPAGVTLLTVTGAAELDRLGIWMRTGDVDGDGVADIVTSADQEDGSQEPNRGAVYVIRGGGHLAGGGLIDLADFGSTALAGHLVRVIPPPGSSRYHFGSTCAVADLDGNGRAEILASAALARGSAGITAAGAPPGSAESLGGSVDGTLFIVWDDHLPSTPWPADLTLDLAAPPGELTVIHGAEVDQTFGEELLGGGDYDGNGTADLVVGDLLSMGGENEERTRPGQSYVIFDAPRLRGLEFSVGNPPPRLSITRIPGPSTESLSSDTVVHGDFDGDGFDDLAIASPYAQPQGRFRAGTLHVIFGRDGGWPPLLDLAPEALATAPETVRIVEIQGARGALSEPLDRGDTLAYSAATADIDGDDRLDLIFNEMLGNGVRPETVDVGNLVILSNKGVVPRCSPAPTTLCLGEDRFELQVEWRDFDGAIGLAQVVTGLPAVDSGLFWFFDSDNWEMLVKVLDGCGVNNRFWVFAAATTNVEYTLRVTDTETGLTREYFNPLGRSADAVTDTSAFATCP